MYRLTLSSVASRVRVMTSSSSPVLTGTTSVCRSPLEKATIRSVTRFTGREMDRASRRTSRMETTRKTRVERMATSIAPLMKWL